MAKARDTMSAARGQGPGTARAGAMNRAENRAMNRAVNQPGRGVRIADFAMLAALLAVALVVLLPLATADLPYVHHADEPTNLAVIHAMMADGTANPRFFNYPSLMFYANLPGQLLAEAVSPAPVTLDVQAMGTSHAPTPQTMLFARGTSLLAHLLTVAAVVLFLVPRAGRMLAGAAGGLAALSPLVPSYGIWAAPDVFATLFVTLCLLACVRIVETGRVGAFVLAAVMAGLAASAKYNVGAVVVAIGVAALAAPGAPAFRAQMLARAGAVALAAFLAASPFILLDLDSSVSGFLFELQHYKTGHIGAEGGALAFNTARLWGGIGLALILAPAAGRNRAWWPVLAFACAYFALLSIQLVRFDRNLAPLVPAFAMLAAIGAAVLRERALSVMPGIWASFAVTALLALALAAPVVLTPIRAGQAGAAEAQAARAWLAATLPPGSEVVVEAYTPYVGGQGHAVTAVGFAFREAVSPVQGHLVLSRQASQRFLDDPRTRPAFLAWVRDLESRACAIDAHPDALDWRAAVFSFSCDGRVVAETVGSTGLGRVPVFRPTTDAGRPAGD